ncbi:MAG: Fe-S oxidoreductase [Coriobacteriia bacterium]|nr:Fe-S oxidoreductase [Coriobacteriia bacterium]
MAQVLLVQPRFPVPRKSHFHRDYLPVGLLKIGAWRRSLGDDVKLVVWGDPLDGFTPDEVYVTSLFTFWSEYVREAVQGARSLFPGALIRVGGIYASLAPKECKEFTGSDEVHEGIHPEAEAEAPAFDLVETDYQIVHASRGCVRRCDFCGTYRIEPKYKAKKTIKNEIVKPKVVFYDNNLLANPHIENILEELADFRLDGRVISCESQSGLDGRILQEKPHLAALLKAARFRNARIAWDGPLADDENILTQLDILRDAGYSNRQLQVFMLYNHDRAPEEVFAKVEQCSEWGVQVSDCRYRPLDRYVDGYDPRAKSQTRDEYFLADGWRDEQVRGLRRTVRLNNICIRYGIPRERYSSQLERIPRAARSAAAASLGLDASSHEEDEIRAINTTLLGGRKK